MRRDGRRRLAALAVSLLCGAAWLGCASQEGTPTVVSAAQGETVTTGTWGGDGIVMEVTEKGATIEYVCAHGSIDHQLVTEAGGRFRAKGAYVREGFGPERDEEEREREGAREGRGAPVLYSGRTDGKTMTLTVRFAASNDEVGSFTLTHGKKVRLVKCK
jgi:hypothetical protein